MYLCFLFSKVKDLVSSTKSFRVDLGVFFWSRFAVELEYLVYVMKEYQTDLDK